MAVAAGVASLAADAGITAAQSDDASLTDAVTPTTVDDGADTTTDTDVTTEDGTDATTPEGDRPAGRSGAGCDDAARDGERARPPAETPTTAGGS